MASSSSSNSTLEQMITQNKFDPSFSDQLRGLARNDPTLIILLLHRYQIGDTEAAAIAQALSSNSTFTSLSLSGNKIGETGAASIAQALTSNSTLTSLDLDRNHVSWKSYSSFGEYLHTNHHNKIMRAKTLQQLCYSSLRPADKDILLIEFPSFFFRLYFSSS